MDVTTLLIGGRRECLVPAATLEEQPEARRALRHHTSALTKHTSITRQRQPGNRTNITPEANKSGARKNPVNQATTAMKGKAKHH